MTPDDIGKLQNYLEGAFPTSKLSPSKVFDAWTKSKWLVDFPNQRRADLARHLVDNCKEFPTLQQLESAARTILRRELPKIDSCLICDDTLWIHYEPTDRVNHDGSRVFDGDPFTHPRVKIVAGKETTLQYRGQPIEYAHPKPCPACNH